ncbi:MAG: hypothetical protein IIB00_10660, partial [candidate division Zixibacteria bacterium]|nr:hypothetical protein [candidate division Zixibacteria bacterium]
SSATTLASDANDSSFDAWMDSGGDIFMVYTAATSFNLLFRRVTFSGGAWSPGSAVTINSTDDCYYPSVTLEPPNRLWALYTRVTAGSYYINAIKSDDWGVTWIVGAGEVLTGAETSAFSKVVIAGIYIYAIYTLSGTKLAVKRKAFNAGIFDSETILASGSGYDEHFHAAVASDDRIGVVYDNSQLNFREWDGDSWLAATLLDSLGADYPRIKFADNVPFVFYLQSSGTGQFRTLTTNRRTGSFSTPIDLTKSGTSLEKVFLYGATAGTYEDLTTAASDSTSADIFHSNTSALLKDKDDALYFGMSERFYYLKALLSTVGTGGALVWQYFDGSSWITFTPSGGVYDLTASDKELLLWNDLDSTPQAWERNTVNGSNLYFVRAVVGTAFSVAPIGTQLTAISNSQALITEE